MDELEKAVREMLAAEPEQPEKDAAGIYIPGNLDTNIRRKALLQALEKAKQ